MASPHLCPWWLSYTFDHRLRRVLHKPEQILAAYIKAGMTVLDLGCGMGYFSIPMARMVGVNGKVLAADIQQRGLDVLMRRARKAGVDSQIRPCLCDPDLLRVGPPADFALAFFMVHETPDPAQFLVQVHACLKPRSLFLFVEPRWHVPRAHFDRMLETAGNAGFQVVDRPYISISHAALLVSADDARRVDANQQPAAEQVVHRMK